MALELVSTPEPITGNILFGRQLMGRLPLAHLNAEEPWRKMVLSCPPFPTANVSFELTVAQ